LKLFTEKNNILRTSGQFFFTRPQANQIFLSKFGIRSEHLDQVRKLLSWDSVLHNYFKPPSRQENKILQPGQLLQSILT